MQDSANFRNFIIAKLQASAAAAATVRQRRLVHIQTKETLDPKQVME
jgi:hypothetical protein